jgi:hypothetical protein
MKLTEPQWMLLREVAAGKRSCSTSYRPAQRLAAIGYCTWHHGSLGGDWLELTPAGRAALKKEGEYTAHDGGKI